jgi:UDP-glucose 4-epimerase
LDLGDGTLTFEREDARRVSRLRANLIRPHEDLGTIDVAKLVQEIAREECGIDEEVQLVENSRSGETCRSEFGVETSRTENELGWQLERSVAATVRRLLSP